MLHRKQNRFLINGGKIQQRKSNLILKKEDRRAPHLHFQNVNGYINIHTIQVTYICNKL